MLLTETATMKTTAVSLLRIDSLCLMCNFWFQHLTKLHAYCHAEARL